MGRRCLDADEGPFAALKGTLQTKDGDTAASRLSSFVLRLGPWGWDNRAANVALALLVFAAWYLASAAALWQFVWDEPEDHWINIATIAQGNFYPRLAFAPDKALQYHYGFDLLAAAVQRLSGLPIWWSIDAITIVLAPMLVWLAVAFAWRLTRHAPASLLTGALFFFGGGMRVTLLLHAAREWLRSGLGFWQAMQRTPPPFNDIYDPFIWGVHDHNRALATTAIFAVLLTLASLLERPTSWRALLLGGLVGLVALVSETDFVILMAATSALAGLSWLLHARRRTSPATSLQPPAHAAALARPVAIALTVAVALGVVMAFTQGGLLTDALFRNPHDNPQTAFTLRWPPGLPRFQMAPLGPGTPGWISGLLSELGLMVVGIPAVAIYAVLRPDPLVRWLAVGGATGLLLPAFVAYPFLDHDLSRFAVTGIRLFMLGTAPLWRAAWSARRSDRTARTSHVGRDGHTALPAVPPLLARVASVGAVAVSAIGPLAIALYLLPPGGGMVAHAPDLKSGTLGMALGDFLRSATPPRARILTDVPQELATLSGRYAPSDKTLHSLGLGRDQALYTAALGQLDAAALRRLGIDYLAFTASQWRAWPPDVRQELISGQRFLRLTTIGDAACDGDWAAVYLVVGAPRAPAAPAERNQTLSTPPCDVLRSATLPSRSS